MTASDVLWSETRWRNSYLSWLVKDVVGLIDRYFRYALVGMNCELVRETITQTDHLLYRYQKPDGSIVAVTLSRGMLTILGPEPLVSHSVNGSVPVVVPTRDGIFYNIYNFPGHSIYHFDFLTSTETLKNELPNVQLMVFSEKGVLYRCEPLVEWFYHSTWESEVEYLSQTLVRSEHCLATPQVLRMNSTHVFYLMVLRDQTPTIYGINLTTHQYEYEFPCSNFLFVNDDVLILTDSVDSTCCHFVDLQSKSREILRTVQMAVGTQHRIYQTATDYHLITSLVGRNQYSLY